MRERILALQDKVSYRLRDGVPRRQPGWGGCSGWVARGYPPAIAGGSDKSKTYWRSLEELADALEFREFVEREYPQHAEEWNDRSSARTFLKLIGSFTGAAGLRRLRVNHRKDVPNSDNRRTSFLEGVVYARFVVGGSRHRCCRSNEGAHEAWREILISEQPQRRSESAAPVPPTFFPSVDLKLYDRPLANSALREESARGHSLANRRALDEQRPKASAGIRFLTETITSPRSRPS